MILQPKYWAAILDPIVILHMDFLNEIVSMFLIEYFWLVYKKKILNTFTYCDPI